MERVCTVSGQKFQITPEDIVLYEKGGVSLPEISPEEREKQKMIFRNERNLYKRKCSATRKDIISVFSERTPFPVFSQDYWWSDQWDQNGSGQDCDFSRPFFEQFQELIQKAPRLCIINAKSENSEYINFSDTSKNCFLLVGAAECEDCFYGYRIFRNSDIVDCSFVLDSELCYECLQCEHLYECKFCQFCNNSRNIEYCFDCRSCEHCFGCINLVNKKFHIFNKPYSKEDYFVGKEKLLKQYQSKGWELLKLVKKQGVMRPYKLLQCENSVGDNLQKTKNCFQCYDFSESEDCRYCFSGVKNKDSIDTFCFDKSELCFNSAALDSDYATRCSFLVWYSNNIDYCMECFHSHDLFGCIGLKHAKYCILNKQYEKEEYFALRDKIIPQMKESGEWGKFIPKSISPFAYNETIAQEYYPLVKEEAIKQGYGWQDENKKDYQPQIYIIPDSIEDVDDDVLNQVLACKKTGRNYKIQKLELEFYRKTKLPIPRLCPDARHEERMDLRNPRKLWERECAKCKTSIQTTFAPDRPEKVYCEKCYLEKLE